MAALLDYFGQPAIRTQLDVILEQGRLPHAVLMYGEPGSGTLPGALSLATDILCTSPANGKACRQCTSCHRAEKFIHPDLHFLLPLAGSKSLSTEYYPQWREVLQTNPWLDLYQWSQYGDMEGKQADIHSADVRQTVTTLSLQAFEGHNKVLIIWMAHFLEREGNRLLKLIEEPPANTYFILVTHQRDRILPTIRSRCMQLYFPPMEEEAMLHLLTEVYQLPTSKAESVVAQSVRDMSIAMTLTQGSGTDFRDDLATWFRALISGKTQDIVVWSNAMGSREKEQQKQFALYALSFLRNLLWAYGAENIKPHPAGGEEMIRFIRSNYEPVTWQYLVESLQGVVEKTGRNASTKLMWLAQSIGIKNHLAVHRLQHINS